METFNDIYTSYYRRAFLFAKSYVHDEMAAEDIASDCLIILWQKMKETEITNVRYFLFTILKNKAFDYLKHEQIKLNAFENIVNLHNRELSLRISTLEACNPDDIFSTEITEIIRNTLDSLSSQTRRIFEMSRYENYSNKEIADELGITVKGVDYHIAKALKVLLISLRDYLMLFF